MIASLAVRRLAAGLIGLVSALPLAAQGWAGPASIEIRVEDAKGKSVQGAEVVLEYLNVEGSVPPAPLPTDADGHCAIGGLAPGAWSLEVRKPGFMSYRAEILVALEGKPEIVAASQHNVPGAVSTMRVKLGRARNAPLARPAVVVVEAPVPVPAVAQLQGQDRDERLSLKGKTPEEELAPPMPPAAPAPALAPPAPPRVTTAPVPTPAPTPVALAPAAPAPVPTPRAAPTPAPIPVVAPSMAAAPPPVPAPLLVPPAPAPRPAPAPPLEPPVSLAAPMTRNCFECRPGESALAISATVAAGGSGCADDAGTRLRSAALGELDTVRHALGSGCALLRIDLPKGARYAGFRYEAEGPNGRAADCLPGKECPIGASRFIGEPIVRREGESTIVLGLFEASADRRGTFTVYWSSSKK